MEFHELKESVLKAMDKCHCYHAEDELIYYNEPDAMIYSCNVSDIAEDAREMGITLDEAMTMQDGYNFGLCKNTEANLDSLIEKYGEDILHYA